MKIVCIGTFNRDIAQFENGPCLETLGGLLYSVLALTAFSDAKTTIFPVSNVGRDIYLNLLGILKKYPKIETSGLNRTSTKNNTVYLHLAEGKERDEHTDLNLPPMEFAQIEPYFDSDVMMLNFTSGFELSFDTVKKILQNYRGLTYLDIHSLTLGIDDKKHRLRRKLKEGFAWVKGADFVQLTEGETFSFTEYDLDCRPEKIAKSLSGCVHKACLLTKGASGVTVLGKEEVFTVPAEKIDSVVDTTGCGDIFGAGFLIKYLETGDLKASAEFGNKKAGEKCKFAGWTDFF